MSSVRTIAPLRGPGVYIACEAHKSCPVSWLVVRMLADDIIETFGVEAEDATLQRGSTQRAAQKQLRKERQARKKTIAAEGEPAAARAHLLEAGVPEAELPSLKAVYNFRAYQNHKARLERNTFSVNELEVFLQG